MKWFQHDTKALSDAKIEKQSKNIAARCEESGSEKPNNCA
jgi:hypothetical protein